MLVLERYTFFLGNLVEKLAPAQPSEETNWNGEYTVTPLIEFLPIPFL